jgi:hypothetical protein
MPRRPTFSDEEQAKILDALRNDIQDDLSDREVWIARRRTSIEEWLIPEPVQIDYPWEGASNITPPLTARAVRTVFPRILNAFVGADPFAHATPVDPKDRDDAEAKEAYMNYTIKNDIPNFFRELSTWTLDHIIHGEGALACYYERIEELAPTWHLVDAEVPNPVSPDEVVRLTDKMILADLFGEIDPQTGSLTQEYTARALGDHSYRVKYREDGYRKEAVVTIDREEEGLREGQASVTIEGTRITSRIRIRTCDIEDLITPAASTGFQPDEAHHLFRPFWYYPMDIEAEMEKGNYFNLTDGDMMRASLMVGQALPMGVDQDQVKRAKDSLEGIDSIQGLSGVEQNKIRIVESYYPWRIKGKMVQMIFYWIPAIDKLAGWEYLTVKYEHGRRPFIFWPFIALANRAHGIGLADMLAPVQAEAKVIFNQMNNREDLINNPVLLVEQNAGVNPNVFRQLPPGSTVTVRNVERVRALEWAKDAHSGIAILQFLFAFAEQLAGAGELSEGIQPSRPNAPRTARGTGLLIAQSNITLDQHVMTGQEALRELLYQIDGLLLQYMPEEVSFAITGKREARTIKRSQMHSRVKYYFTGNTINTNSQQQQQVAQLLYQSLLVTPFFTGTFLEMPRTSIVSLFKLIDYYSKMHLPGKDASFILPPIEELVRSAEEYQKAKAEGMEAERKRLDEKADQESDREFEVEEAKAATGIMQVLAQVNQGRSDTDMEGRRMEQEGARERESGEREERIATRRERAGSPTKAR